MNKKFVRIALFSLLVCSAMGGVLAQSLPHYRSTPLPLAPINWSTVNSEITQELRRVELGTLAQQTLASPPPADAKSWLRRLAILVRADYPVATQQMLNARPRSLSPDRDWGISALVIESGTFENLELARRLCELFPEQTTGYHWFESWTKNVPPAEVDAWLARQGLIGEQRWFTQRLKFRARLGTEKALLAPLEAQIKAHREQLSPVENYLLAVEATEKPVEMDWLAGVVRPRLAVENFVLGGYLGSKRAAATFFERALKLPFTKVDAEWYADHIRRMHFAYLGPHFVLTEPMLRQWTKSLLLRCYQANGEVAKAQRLLEQITAEQPGGIPNVQLAFQAGEIQGNSGARVVEQRIRKAEPAQDRAGRGEVQKAVKPKEVPGKALEKAATQANQGEVKENKVEVQENKADETNTAEYWLTRGLYFSGRKEDAQAVDAFEKGLALAPMPADGKLTVRWRITTEYARHLWLRDIDHPTDAFRFVRKELDLAPLDSDYARGLITELLHYDQRDDSRLISPDDDRLWGFVAAQSDSQVHGRMLLERLVRNAPAEQRDALIKRAEALAENFPTPERSLALGTLMTSLKRYERASFWVEDALSRLTDKDRRQSALNDLWQTYRFRSDWRGMARLIPQMEQGHAADWLATSAVRDMALAAAEAGALEEARQFFRQWANQDRRRVPSELYPLPSHGLLPELRAYYRQIAQAEPLSAAPARVFKQIGAGQE